MKILIVDDNAQIVHLITMGFNLRWPESCIIHTRSGAKAISLIERESPDIIILDINIPDIDGFKVLHQIRLFSDVPIVILTAKDLDIGESRTLQNKVEHLLKQSKLQPDTILFNLINAAEAL